MVVVVRRSRLGLAAASRLVLLRVGVSVGRCIVVTYPPRRRTT